MRIFVAGISESAMPGEAAALRDAGHEVAFPPPDEAPQVFDPTAVAVSDWMNVVEANVLVAFTESRPTDAYVGAALAAGARVILIGSGTHLWHQLPDVESVANWAHAAELIATPPVLAPTAQRDQVLVWRARLAVAVRESQWLVGWLACDETAEAPNVANRLAQRLQRLVADVELEARRGPLGKPVATTAETGGVW